MTAARLEQIRRAAAATPIHQARNGRRFVLFKDLMAFGELAIFHRQELLEALTAAVEHGNPSGVENGRH